EYLHLSYHTVLRYIKKGKIPASKFIDSGKSSYMILARDHAKWILSERISM
ncbi:MAG: helix-turn-helix domain-containing protein, partial [Planctomycetes bacterium]|nr:helix-turn-helix domain-containing protein [Planctomycetota bacterium]